MLANLPCTCAEDDVEQLSRHNEHGFLRFRRRLRETHLQLFHPRGVNAIRQLVHLRNSRGEQPDLIDCIYARPHTPFWRVG